MSLPAHDCVGALLVRDGAVLLGRRTAGRAWLAEAWDVFGGHIEPGESAQEAIVRELDEELGITPLQMRPLAMLGAATPEPWRLQLFVVSDWRGDLHNRQPEEHAELRWCTLVEAQQRLAAAHPDFPHVLAEALFTR